MIQIPYPCPHCNSTRAGVPLKPRGCTDVKCADCGRRLGDLSDIRREIAQQARDDGSQLAKRIYRQGSTRGKLWQTP
jgi:transposase-like protein